VILYVEMQLRTKEIVDSVLRARNPKERLQSPLEINRSRLIDRFACGNRKFLPNILDNINIQGTPKIEVPLNREVANRLVVTGTGDFVDDGMVLRIVPELMMGRNLLELGYCCYMSERQTGVLLGELARNTWKINFDNSEKIVGVLSELAVTAANMIEARRLRRQIPDFAEKNQRLVSLSGQFVRMVTLDMKRFSSQF